MKLRLRTPFREPFVPALAGTKATKGKIIKKLLRFDKSQVISVGLAFKYYLSVINTKLRNYDNGQISPMIGT